MINRTAHIIKLHTKDKFSWFYLPWMILLSSFAVNLVISIFLEEPLYTGGLSSIYIYMLVVGIVVLPQTFPFALGLSVRRTDYYAGTLVTITLVSIAFATILFLLSLIETNLTNNWGSDLHFFNLPYLNEGSVFAQLWIYFIVMFHMFSLGFVISSIYQRIGRNGTFIFFLIVFLLFTICTAACTYFKWWNSIFSWFGSQSALDLSIWLVPGAIIYMLASYFLLRKTTV